MAVSGTMTAGDMVTFNNAETDLDIGDSGTFVGVETWTTDVRVTRGTRPSATQKSHGNISETVVGAREADQVEIDFFYTEGSTDPFYNLVTVYEGAGSQLCDVQWNKNGGTTGDLRFTTAAAKIIGLTFPPMSAGDAQISTFTLTVEGNITTTVIS